MRHAWPVTSIFAASALLLASCGGGDAEDGAAELDMEASGAGAMEDFAAGDTFVATEPVEFSLLYRDHPNYPIESGWDFFTQLEEEHGVTLETSNAPLSDWAERRALVIGAGDAPDFIPITYPGDETQFIAGGALLPVSDYVDLMPNFLEKVEEWGLEEDLASLYQEDGKFYVLPGLHEAPQAQYSFAVRGDIWDELDLGEPESFEEFADQLREVQAAYPDMIPFSDRWSENGPLEATLTTAAPNFGTSAGWGYGDGMHYDAEADEFVYAGAMDEYRDLIGYFAELVDEGLMDSESLTQDDDQAVQKFASGQSAVIGANDQTVLEYRTSVEEVGDEDMEVRQIRVPAGPAGDKVAGSRFESGIALSASTAEEDDFVALMQFLDWLYYSDEGMEFAKWGVEDETYTVDDDGTRTLAENVNMHGLNPEAEEELNVDYGYHNGVFLLAHGSSTELVQSMLRDEVIEFRESMDDKELVPPAPARPLDELERERASISQTQLTDQVRTATAQFILGQRDIEDWDAFVAELESSGMAEFVDLHNEAYQRAQENIDSDILED
ncbi:extracellular solute-binding protein [Nesterenkonia sp. E16_7]|nr:extracellular solute-binding protein [Nesterenkonia sp. E16_10]MBO0599089.1 extracellular solute-binding protein [Nesterenkonia sp. E16_7]